MRDLQSLMEANATRAAEMSAMRSFNEAQLKARAAYRERVLADAQRKHGATLNYLREQCAALPTTDNVAPPVSTMKDAARHIAAMRAAIQRNL
jgi:hypothetical protein